MEVLFFIIPISLCAAGTALWSFIWAVKNKQFEDLDSPAKRLVYEPEQKGSMP